MEELVPIGLVLVFSFLIRLSFVLGHTSDEWVTWWVIFQQQGKWLHYDVPDSLIEGFFGYPKLQYYLISRFPQKLWGIIGNISNIGYDCFAIVLVYYLSTIFFSNLETSEIIFGIRPAMWVALLYSTTPILLPVTGRLKGVKARTLGGLFSLLYFVTFGAAYVAGHSYLYAATIIAGILAMLSSAFALQNIAFMCLCLSVFYFDWVPLSVFLITLLAGLGIPKVGINKILLHKLNHYRWYVRNYEGSPAEGRNSLRDILLLPKYLFVQPIKFLNLVFEKITPVIALYSVPGLFILAYYIFTDPNSLGLLLSNDVTKYASIMVSGSIIVFIFTSIKPLLFLGQAERYFEYSAPFLNFLFVFYVIKTELSTNILFLLLLFHLCVILVAFVYSMGYEIIEAFQPLSSIDKKNDLVHFLNNLDKDLRILTIPLKFSFALSHQMQNPKARFYHMFVSRDHEGFEYMEEDLVKYNWPRPDWLYFKQKYGVNMIVVLKKALRNAREHGLNYELNQKNCIFENTEYAIYRL